MSDEMRKAVEAMQEAVEEGGVIVPSAVLF